MSWQLTLAGGYEIDDDPTRLDLDAIHRFLAEEAYWARGRDRATFERAVAHSICLGLYAPDGTQAGFARAMTDRAIRAHLVDVFVLPAHRGGGRGKALVQAMLDHPELRTVAAWTLTTRDAHGLYAHFGFIEDSDPQNHLIRRRPHQGG